jgi:hypothetical protein
MIVTTLLCISLAIIIYSALKGRKMMSVLLKFMMLSLLIIGLALAQDEPRLLGLPGIPDPNTPPMIIDIDSPIIISVSDADAAWESNAWLSTAMDFLNGNETIVNNNLNNTTLVIA